MILLQAEKSEETVQSEAINLTKFDQVYKKSNINTMSKVDAKKMVSLSSGGKFQYLKSKSKKQRIVPSNTVSKSPKP